MQRLAPWCYVVCLLPVLAGCSPKTKPAMVQVNLVTYRSSQTIADLETVLAQAGAIPAPTSRQIYGILRPAAELGIEATTLLRLWNPDAPMPPQLPALIAQMIRLTATIISLLPTSEATEAALESAAKTTMRLTPEEQLVELDRLWRALLVQIDRRLQGLGPR